MVARALPPGPSEPALLQTLQWLRDPLDYLDRARARFGPIWTSRLVGFPPLVHLSDPDAIQEVFTGDSDVLHAGEANRVLEPVVGTESLLTLDGPRHLKHRRALIPLFQGERGAIHARVFHAAASRAVTHWPRGRPIRVYDEMQSLALDAILECLFGLDDDSAASVASLRTELTELLHGIVHPILLLRWAQIDLGRLTPWHRLMELRAAIDRRIYTLIEARRARADERTDMLALLVRAREEDGRLMTAKTLRDEIVTLIVAGHDTVATGLTWTFHHLLANPLARDRARAEADEAFAGADFDPTAKRPWIDAVARESLRLTPVLPIVARRLRKDLTIGGMLLPRGARPAPNVYLTHREAAHWPEPTRFLPERFLTTTPSIYAYLPFGGGVRRCIGMNFALVEMRVVVATVLRHLEVERAPGPCTRPTRRGVVITPSDGLPIVVRDRSPS